METGDLGHATAGTYGPGLPFPCVCSPASQPFAASSSSASSVSYSESASVSSLFQPAWLLATGVFVPGHRRLRLAAYRTRLPPPLHALVLLLLCALIGD